MECKGSLDYRIHDFASSPVLTSEAGLLTTRITESPLKNILLTYRSLLTTVPRFLPLPPLETSVHVSLTSSNKLNKIQMIFHDFAKKHVISSITSRELEKKKVDREKRNKSEKKNKSTSRSHQKLTSNERGRQPNPKHYHTRRCNYTYYVEATYRFICLS